MNVSLKSFLGPSFILFFKFFSLGGRGTLQTNQVVMSLPNFSGPPSVKESPIIYHVLPIGTSGMEIKYGGYS